MQDQTSDSDRNADGAQHEPVTLTDNVGIIGLTTQEYGDLEKHATTVPLSELKRAIEIVETLGWTDVDVDLIEPPTDAADYPMLAFRHPGGLMNNGKPGAVTVAPKSEKGRKRAIEHAECDD